MHVMLHISTVYFHLISLPFVNSVSCMKGLILEMIDIKTAHFENCKPELLLDQINQKVTNKQLTLNLLKLKR